MTYEGQVVIGVWTQDHLKVDPMIPLIYSMVISPVPEYIIEIVTFRNFQNPSISSLIHGLWIILEVKANWKQLKLQIVEIVPPSWNTTSDPYNIPIQLTYLACAEDRLISGSNSGLL